MIACEGIIFNESKSFKDSLIDLMAAYHVFNIAYPKPLAPSLIFFQHYVFGLKDEQEVPIATAKLVNS